MEKEVKVKEVKIKEVKEKEVKKEYEAPKAEVVRFDDQVVATWHVG